MKCSECGLINPPSAARCDCGFDFRSGTVEASYVYPRAQDASGRGAASVVPPAIQRWNWGAFFLSWIWGLQHQVYWSLLVFVPVVGLFVPFVLGAKGNEYAWRAGNWDSTEELLDAQRTWMRWGVGIYAAGIAVSAALFFGGS